MNNHPSQKFPTNPRHGSTVKFSDLGGSTYFYDRPRKSWIFLTRPVDEKDFAKVTFGPEPHILPDIGDLWITPNYIMYTYDGTQWVSVSSDGTFGKVKVSPNEPGQGPPGMLWYDSNTSDLKILYDDGDSTQWVSVTAMNGGVNITSSEMQTQINSLSVQLGRLGTDLEQVRQLSVNTDGLLELD